MGVFVSGWIVWCGKGLTFWWVDGVVMAVAMMCMLVQIHARAEIMGRMLLSSGWRITGR